MRRLEYFVLLLSLLLTTFGCAPHVRLDPIDPAAELPRRQRAYDRLQPIGRGHDIYVKVVDDSVRHEIDTEKLRLAGGEVVHHPNDLLPVVDPDSATAAAALQYEKWQSIDTLSYVLAGTLLGASAGVAAASWPELRDGSMGAIWAVGGLAFSAVAVRTIFGLVSSSRMNRARREAFDAYPTDLREHLRLD